MILGGPSSARPLRGLRSNASAASAALPRPPRPTRALSRSASPAIIPVCFIRFIRSLLLPFEQCFELGAGELGGDGAAVGTVGGDLDAVHGGEEGLDLRRVEPLTDPHDRVAGDRRERRIHGAFGGGTGAFVGELGGERAHEGARVTATK